MHRLVISHVPGQIPHQFVVQRLFDGKTTAPFEVASPHGYPVKGRPGSDLATELGWYLENFLDYPFPPETERATHVLESLRHWGREAFETLFGGAKSGRWLADAHDDGPEQVSIQIASDDPAVLGWPWEALDDPERGWLAHHVQILRRLDRVADPLPLSDRLPGGRVNILLVTARPYERDVAFRSVSRPLVELGTRRELPASVHLLRPPTLDRLREHLRERPDHYHIVHFDGHGAYGGPSRGGAGYTFREGPQGYLVFETERGEPDPVSADTLATLLREHRVPAVVLNACQSAMIDARAEDAFASVASSMLRAGVRSVVAMAYSLYVSGAHEFIPAFYGRLFETASPAAGVRAGRQQMLAHKDRVCIRGKYPLEDWIVPTLYEQDRLAFDFSKPAVEEVKPTLPPEARDGQNPYGFVGRDGPILALERAIRRPPAGVLVQGLGGVGKTTLARGFLQWLRDTDGLLHDPLWLTFDDIHGADYVFNQIGQALVGPEVATLTTDEKIDLLARMLQEDPRVIVWDNFESVRGVVGTEERGLLSAQDQAALKRFLEKLRGGKTTVLITSRSTEDWLGTANRFVLPITGLQGEERWRFCEVILDDLGLAVDRSNPDLAALMNRLDGHPLLMRVVLSRLEEQTPKDLLQALDENLESFGHSGSEAADKVFATLRFVETALPIDLHPLLLPLALHERFVGADGLYLMANRVSERMEPSMVERLMEALSDAGLVEYVDKATYRMHPLLTTYLQSSVQEKEYNKDEHTMSFVRLMATLANSISDADLYVHRDMFLYHKANFYRARREARRLDMGHDAIILSQALALYALSTRNFEEAVGLYKEIASNGNDRYSADAYHQLGIIARKHGAHKESRQMFYESISIEDKLNNEHGKATTWLELGIVAHDLSEYDEAINLYNRALVVFERERDRYLSAATYHELGLTNRVLNNLDEAEKWYKKALDIFKRLKEYSRVALACYELGNMAFDQERFEDAEIWHKQSLSIRIQLKDEYNVAYSYYQIGRIARNKFDLQTAEEYLIKSINIFDQIKHDPGSALCYYQIGMIRLSTGALNDAEGWYNKALSIFQRIDHKQNVANTQHQLGLVAEQREQYMDAGSLFVLSILAHRQFNDIQSSEQSSAGFRRVISSASPEEREHLLETWTDAGLPPIHGSAPDAF